MSIGSIGFSNLASQLFSKLDTSGQGYLSKSDLATALSKTSSSASGSASSDVDSLFSQLDNDQDGKVTKQEFTDTLTQLADQLASQALQAGGGMPGGGMGGGMSGGMPPPPPPNDAGFTKDELQSQLDEIGSSDSKRSSLISNIVANFDQADTDGDGKVSFKEAMSFDKSSRSNSSSASSSASSAGTASSAADTGGAGSDLNLKLMQQIMQLARAYSIGNDQQDSLVSTLSVTA